jgi:hypothetical protein
VVSVPFFRSFTGFARELNEDDTMIALVIDRKFPERGCYTSTILSVALSETKKKSCRIRRNIFPCGDDGSYRQAR